MSALKGYNLQCNGDGCGYTLPLGSSTVTAARQDAKDMGWLLLKKRSGWRDLCPSCARLHLVRQYNAAEWARQQREKKRQQRKTVKR